MGGWLAGPVIIVPLCGSILQAETYWESKMEHECGNMRFIKEGTNIHKEIQILWSNAGAKNQNIYPPPKKKKKKRNPLVTPKADICNKSEHEGEQHYS